MLKNSLKIKSRQKGKSVKRKPRYWVLSVTAVGLLIAYTVGESRALNIAHVKENRITASKKVEDKNGAIRRFYLPAGSLSEVLTAFEKLTGWRFSVSDDIKNIPSQGVSGDYTEEQALKQILQNTGVTY